MDSSEPENDPRFQRVHAAMKTHLFQPDALLEVLHQAQKAFGHLHPDLLRYVARGLKLPPSRVHGVATFYHLFTFKPKGAHHCNLCMGTACFVHGAEALKHALEAELGIPIGQTRGDGLASLSIVRCTGTCGLAPLAILDGAVAGRLTPETAVAQVKGWLGHGPG